MKKAFKERYHLNMTSLMTVVTYGSKSSPTHKVRSVNNFSTTKQKIYISAKMGNNSHIPPPLKLVPSGQAVSTQIYSEQVPVI